MIEFRLRRSRQITAACTPRHRGISPGSSSQEFFSRPHVHGRTRYVRPPSATDPAFEHGWAGMRGASIVAVYSEPDPAEEVAVPRRTDRRRPAQRERGNTRDKAVWSRPCQLQTATQLRARTACPQPPGLTGTAVSQDVVQIAGSAACSGTSDSRRLDRTVRQQCSIPRHL